MTRYSPSPADILRVHDALAAKSYVAGHADGSRIVQELTARAICFPPSDRAEFLTIAMRLASQLEHEQQLALVERASKTRPKTSTAPWNFERLCEALAVELDRDLLDKNVRAEFERNVRRAIGALDFDKMILVAAVLSGRPMRASATLVGTSAATVSNRFHSIVKEIAQLLANGAMAFMAALGLAGRSWRRRDPAVGMGASLDGGVDCLGVRESLHGQSTPSASHDLPSEHTTEDRSQQGS